LGRHLAAADYCTCCSPRRGRSAPPWRGGGMATLLGGVCQWYIDHPIQAKHAPLMMTDLPAPLVDRFFLCQDRGTAAPPLASCHPPIHRLSRRDCGVASGRPPSNGGTVGPSVHAYILLGRVLMVLSAAPLPPSTPSGEGGLRAASSWVKVESSLWTLLGGRGLLRLLQPSPRPLRHMPQSGEEPPSRLKYSSCLLAASIVGL
jgi:hypothetical protein